MNKKGVKEERRGTDEQVTGACEGVAIERRGSKEGVKNK